MVMNESKSKILMIDDDVKLCRLVKDYLAPFGFETQTANDGLSGLEIAKEKDFDAIILDVMMPKMDGFEVLKELRKISDVPVLMLTALGDEPDRIVGLEIGADDYLPKTFSTRELLARLRAATRRSKIKRRNNDFEEKLEIGEISINTLTYEAFVNGDKLNLTALEFDLLQNLAESAGRVLSRDQLLDAVAGRNYEVFDRSIDVHISSLRKKLGDDFKNPKFIKTIRSVGYMLVNGSENDA